MRHLILLIVTILSTVTLHAQAIDGIIADSVGYNIIQKSEKKFPKFYREFQQIKKNDSLIKKFIFIQKTGTGPAFASPKGNIVINVEYFKSPKPNFDDDRLIVVLYHEVGHLHYFVTVNRASQNSEDSEGAAFEYSLVKTKEMAEKGDCQPLVSGLKFMKMRSMGNNLQDPHVRALKRIITQPLYTDYAKYAADKCNARL